MTGIGLASAFVAGIGLGVSGALLALAIGIFLWAARQAGRGIVLVAIVLALLGAWRGQELAEPGVRGIAPGQVTLNGIVDSFPVDSVSILRFEFRPAMPFAQDPARLCVTAEPTAGIEKGSSVEVVGVVTPLFDLPADLQGALQASQCSGSLEASEIVTLEGPSGLQSLLNAVHDRISATFQRSSPGDKGALMTGLVTGDDSALSREARSAFLRTGTSHITAVSGSNFALIVLIATMASAGPGTRRRLPWMFATTTAVWIYAVLVGLPPSSLRAALMATLALVALRFGRRPDFLSLLVICAALQLAFRPSDLHSLSFQLSFLATLALVLVYSNRDISRSQLPAAIVITAVAAHLATIPALAFRLDEITPATIPTNILIAPLTMTGFSLAALAAAIGMISPAIGTAAAIPASIVAGAILSIVERAGTSLPGTVTTGAASTASLIVVSVACWSVILAMSGDVRVSLARTRTWISDTGASTRLAILAPPMIALAVYALEVLVR